MIEGAAVIADVCAAVRRLASAASTAELRAVATDARTIADAIERIGMSAPFSVALVGDARARAAFLCTLAGDAIVDADRVPADGAIVSVRRGAVTSCRARLRDGTEEVRAGEPRVIAPPSPALPLPVAAPERVPWWALWRRLRRWLASRKQPQLPPPPPAAVPPVAPAVRDPFVEAVRALTDARARGATVERLFIELARGPLGDDVVVLELPAGIGTRVFEQAELDGALLVGERDASAQTALAVLGALYTLGDEARDDATPLGDAATAIAALGPVLRAARVRRLVTRGTQALRRGADALDATIARAEADFAARLGRLEAMQIDDPAAHEAREVARAMPQILERVHMLIAEATNEHGRELEQLHAAWAARITAVTTTDELRAIVAAIDVEAPGQLAAARADAVRLVTGGLAGSTHDVYPMLMAALPGGAPAGAAPTPSAIELAGGGGGLELGDVAPRFRSLVRSTDKLRAAALDKLAERVTVIRRRAGAALLDAEPALVAAVTEPLRAAFADALARHVAWLRGELDRERDAVERERARLAPAIHARDAARADEAALARRAADPQPSAADP